jgi:hypothetical protein
MSLLGTTAEWKELVRNWEGVTKKPRPTSRDKVAVLVMENRFIERVFATSHWIMPGVWFLPIVTICIMASVIKYEMSAGIIFLLVTAGTLFWTLLEYWLHRWLFHLPPSSNWTLRQTQYMLHGYHHDYPNDPGRLVAPPVLSWPIAICTFVVQLALLGSWALPLFAGTCLGYLAYDWVHYYTHHASPKTKAGKFIRRFHLEHHYRYALEQYGISSPLWDLVFRTWPHRNR